MIFDDREDAGEKLAEELVEQGVEADLVLAIPRGGLPLGREVADALDADLDVVVAKKVPAPGNPELALGAVASDGSRWMNDELLERLGVEESYIEDAVEGSRKKAVQKLENYRGSREQPDVAGKRVVVVDDGIATGATMIACVRQLKSLGAEEVTVAVPVASRDSADIMRKEADRALVLETPPGFSAVGQFYTDFRQVTDEEAKKYLRV